MSRIRSRLAAFLLLSYSATPLMAWCGVLSTAIWPEWQVADGQKVLVSKVYFAKADIDNNKGVRIVGADLAITMRELENTGTQQASNSLAINASGKVSGGGGYSGGKAVAIQM